MFIVGGLFIQMVVLASLLVKLLLDGVISRSPHGRTDVMFGLVVTTEAPLAFSCARIHSNNTAEMTAMFGALSFLGPRGLVALDEQSRIYFDSMHAAGICLGTILARPHVQLALACQQSTIRAQHRLRLNMQHVSGHGGNLGNECADHVKGMYPAPDIHEHFTIHKWLRQTAYIFTQNMNNLEHIANNCMSAMTHTDVTTAHH